MHPSPALPKAKVSKAETRTRAGGNRREAIIKAASRLFREKGFEGTTVRDLAEAVDLHSGSLFFHFASKEEIFLAVLQDGLRHAISTLNTRLKDSQTPTERLAVLFHVHLEAVLGEERDSFTVLLQDWRNLSPQSRKQVTLLRDEYEGHFGRILNEVAAEGLVPKDARLFRFFLLGALNWTVQWYRPDGNLTVDQLADVFLSFVLPDHPAPKP